jgi:hypothetical protein
MATPIFNIVLGVFCVLGGVSGRLSLFGTHGGTALVLAGIAAAGLGTYQLWRRLGR